MNACDSATEFNFGANLLMSQGERANTSIERILLEKIPGALAVNAAHRENDRCGTDWWVEIAGRHLSVDAKVREEDWSRKSPPRDDLALETWSVKGYFLLDGTQTAEPMIPGWTRDESKRTDYVIWWWKDTGRFCLVPFPMLCGVFKQKWQDWSREYQTSVQRTRQQVGNRGGWLSECVFVPRVEVWRAIYRSYAGEPRQ